MGDGTTIPVTSAGAMPHVLVIAGAQVSSHPITDGAVLVVGRGKDCDLCIDHASISRRHARLHVGPPLHIEDVGSANGTRVRGQPLRRGQSVPIAIGEVVELGDALLLVEQRAAPRRADRIRSHGYFEARLADECARADARFAVARLHCEPALPIALVEEMIADALVDTDVLGDYGAGELELLVLDVDPATASARLDALVAALAGRGVRARAGVACSPRDGRGPHVLFARACAAIRPGAPPARKRAIVLTDPAMRALHALAAKVAASDLSVLVVGETGAGKELVAEAIHRASRRSRAPLLALNCAALPEGLLESELFGHEKGSFTGAHLGKVGLLESADGGTVFLDEIGDLPAVVQTKLLRVLEDRAVLRVGGLKPRTLDVRFVAATHRDLEAAVARGTFREDLYYRLNGITLRVPPLRERPTEIAPLARAFAAEAARVANRAAPSLAPAAIALLAGYAWPGNVRELRNVVERAVVLCDGVTITPADLPEDKLAAPAARPVPAPGRDELRRDLAAVERDHIVSALAQCAGNQTEAAKLLGLSRRTLSTKLDTLGVPRPRKR